MSAVSIIWFLPADTLSTVTCILKRTPKRANFKILSTLKKFLLYQKALYLIFQASLLFATCLFLGLQMEKKKKRTRKHTETYSLVIYISLVAQGLYLAYHLSEWKIWSQRDSNLRGFKFQLYHFLDVWLRSRGKLFELHILKGKDRMDCPDCRANWMRAQVLEH